MQLVLFATPWGLRTEESRSVVMSFQVTASRKHCSVDEREEDGEDGYKRGTVL
jgi:hypothetical protein